MEYFLLLSPSDEAQGRGREQIQEITKNPGKGQYPMEINQEGMSMGKEMTIKENERKDGFIVLIKGRRAKIIGRTEELTNIVEEYFKK
jgi:hypothetical protein